TKWQCQFEDVTAKWPTRQQATLKSINLASSLIEKNVKLPLMGPSGHFQNNTLSLQNKAKSYIGISLIFT
ncbi:hypothetical protein, partial [Candidatus Marithrix sp. Canyon 246]